MPMGMSHFCDGLKGGPVEYGESAISGMFLDQFMVLYPRAQAMRHFSERFDAFFAF
jgi:hypothetical protein